MGLIAQNVEQVFPQVVTEEDFGEENGGSMKTVDYAALVAPLIEAVKELKARNEVLKANNEELQELNASILKRLDALEAHAMH
ncbi:MAG: hypothetical protein M5U16_01445 [Hyphomicrobium sp.]|nr:hypothetical protein [Hyphomicrobium sp.]